MPGKEGTAEPQPESKANLTALSNPRNRLFQWTTNAENQLVITPSPLSVQSSQWGWVFVIQGL